VRAEPRSKRKKLNRERLDFLDDWQYRIFKVIVFIIFVVYSLQFLDDKIHVSKPLEAIWRYLKSWLS
jgi:hypothetical protein